MWVVIYMAPDAAVAQALRERLEEEGILVQLRDVYKKRGTPGKSQDVEVRVLRSEAQEAQRVLLTMNMTELTTRRERT